MPRRIPTIPIASAGSPPHITITEERWSELSDALQVQISAELREEVVRLTNDFLSWADFERNAEPVTGAEERLKAMTDAGLKLLNTLQSRESGDARFFAEFLIGKHFLDKRIAPLSAVMAANFFKALLPTDLDAVVVYLRSVKPIRNSVPDPVYKAPVHRDPYPDAEKGFTPAEMKDPVRRGAYLATVGHCMECHSAWEKEFRIMKKGLVKAAAGSARR